MTALREGLKPCPFCGESKYLRVMSAADYWEDSSCAGTTVLCKCGAHCGWIKTTKAAKERWNRRPESAMATGGEVKPMPPGVKTIKEIMAGYSSERLARIEKARDELYALAAMEPCPHCGLFPNDPEPPR
jgi:hypothetical protein